jgi:hypothetical protein
MIRTEVIAWTTILLITFFALILMPAHERFVDAEGREVDVSPNAPPKPEWLKSTSGSTGKKESFWNFFSATRREHLTGGTGSPPASNLSLLPSPTTAAPRIISTLGVGDPSLSGMNAGYTSGIRPPSGSPWAGLQGLTEMASEVTDPAFRAQTHPNPPLGNLSPVEPDIGLFGPGPNVLRKNLVACTCASQAAGCSVHPRQR